MDDGSPQRYTVIDHNIALDVKISQAASEAPTVSPEVAREDEERRVLARGKMNQHDTLLGMKQPN